MVMEVSIEWPSSVISPGWTTVLRLDTALLERPAPAGPDAKGPEMPVARAASARPLPRPLALNAGV